jgi:Meiotically up-regulated gene 113
MRHRRMTRNDRLYIITTPELWPTKVGWSEKPRARLKTLQDACWRELGLYATYVCRDAFGVEQEVIKRLAQRKIAGEWFDVPAPEVHRLVLELFEEKAPGTFTFSSAPPPERVRRPGPVPFESPDGYPPVE